MKRLSKQLILQTILLPILQATGTFIVKIVLIQTGITITSVNQLVSQNFYFEAIPKVISHPLTWVWFVICGITFLQGIAIFTRVEATRMAFITNLQNVMEIFIGLIIFNEPLTWKLIVACILIFVGYYILVVQKFERIKKEKKNISSCLTLIFQKPHLLW